MKDLYAKSYITLMREIKEDIKKWKDIPHSWNRKVTVVKMSILPKAIFRFNYFLIKAPMTYFIELGKIFLNSFGTKNGLK